MKKGVCFAYAVDKGIYINMTNRCTNSCVFCIRNNGDGAYGSESLWLLYEPTCREVLDAVSSIYNGSVSEFVFCGYGEPTVRLDDVIFVAKRLREIYPGVKVRINTNGHCDLINGSDTSEKFGVFDKVSVSLNASNKEVYQRLCRSAYGEKSFEAMLNFSQNVNNRYKNVSFSVVKEMLGEQELQECFRISESLKIPLRVRNYISE